MDWLRETVAEYLSGFSNETGSPHAARSGFLTQLCRGRRRVGIDDSAACGRTEIKLIPVVVSGKRHEPRVPSPLP